MHLWPAPFSSKDSVSPQLKATCAWTWAVTLSGVGEEVSHGGCCCAAGELETSELIAGERSERSANLERGVIEDVGTEFGGGMRCCSSRTIIRVSPRAKIVKKKKAYPTDPKSSPSESQVPPSQDAPPTPAQHLDRPPPLPSLPQSHDGM